MSSWVPMSMEQEMYLCLSRWSSCVLFYCLQRPYSNWTDNSAFANMWNVPWFFVRHWLNDVGKDSIINDTSSFPNCQILENGWPRKTTVPMTWGSCWLCLNNVKHWWLLSFIWWDASFPAKLSVSLSDITFTTADMAEWLDQRFK
jgi:hypothetical protein